MPVGEVPDVDNVAVEQAGKPVAAVAAVDDRTHCPCVRCMMVL